MNRTYKVVWNESLGTWIAVSELAKGKTKTSTIYLKNDQSVTDLILGQIPRTFQQLALVVAMGIFAPAAWAVDTQCFNGTGTMTTHTLDGGTVTEGRECTGSSQASVIITGNSDGASNSSYSEGVVLQTRINGSSGPTRNLFSGMNANNTDALNIRIGDSRSITNSTFNVFADTLSLGNASTLASATSSQAIGAGATVAAGATNSTAIGTGANVAANQTDAIAIGTSAQTSANDAIAIGKGANASAISSITLGSDSTATMKGAIAIGDGAFSGGKNSGGSIVIGGAIDQSDYAPALSGARNDESAQASIVIGSGASNKGAIATVIGTGASAGVPGGSTVIGSFALSTQSGGTVVGNGAKATGEGATAIGLNSQATLKNSVALGANSQAIRDVSTETAYVPLGGTIAGASATGGEVSVGAVGSERRITNVAAASQDTDAVNLSQLKAAQAAATSHYVSINDNGIQGANYNNDGAQGKNSIAIGIGSKAENENTVAIGSNAVANYVPIGGNADKAVAIGSDVNATNRHAVAIGLGSTASGINSTAIGIGNQATTLNSTAIGNNNKVIGQYASAVGYNNSIVDGFSNIFGHDNSISGSSSAITGNNNTVKGNFVSVLGQSNNVESYYAVALGYNNQLKGDGYAVGSTNNVSSLAIAIGRGNNISGLGSGVIGFDNNVGGWHSSAIGEGNTIGQDFSFVLGRNVTTTQRNSIVLGNESTDRAATAVNKVTVNGKDYTVAGTGSASNGVVSVGKVGGERQIINVAAGEVSATSTDSVNGSQLFATNKAIADSQTHYVSVNDNGTQGANYNNDGAKGKNSIAIGIGSKAENENSVSIGTNATSNYGGIAIGSGAIASNGGSTAIGTNNVALANNAHVFGTNNRSEQQNSSILGNQNQILTSSGTSLAIGNNNTLTSGGAAALGFGNQVSSSGTLALGTGNNVANINATAVGLGNQVLANGSTALGTDNNVTSDSSAVVGRYNTVKDSTVSYVFGQTNTVSGSTSAVIGIGNIVANQNTFVLGNSVKTTQNNSVVLGNASTDRKATAIDKMTINGKDYTLAGKGSAANGIVSVGKAGGERQIINVAAGEVSATSTDSVNGSQLFATNQAIADSQTHYVSVNDNGTQGANYNNDGATGVNALAVGVGASATADNAIAIGNASSGAKNSIAIGTSNVLSNTAVASTAIGTNNNVTGNEALALGTNNTVKDFSGVAVGSYNNAEGYRSIAVGAENKTKGQWSSAFGVWNEAEGERSSVLGANNKIQGRRALGLGVANDISTASEYSSAIGAFNKITDSTQSLAAGYNNTITNAKNSTVLGNANKVEQENTQVLGNKVTTTQANSVVLGNESTDRAATAVDKVTINGEDYSVAGTGAVANGVVSVGKVGGERQIINVAAGEVSASSTDAINGSQLYATNQAITKSIADSQTHYVSINDDGTTGDNYNNDGAVGKNAVAVGVNAAAYGDRATAIGNGSIATTDGIALGSGNQANGLHSIAIGFENITGSGNPDNIVLGISNQVHANNTTVVGRNNTLIANDNNNVFGSDNEIQSPDSKLGNNTVLGNKNKIFSLGEVSNTVLLGNNITATQANSVVLGNASADRAATVVDKISINGQDYLVAGAGSAANGVVSVGKVGGERQIINVAAGEVSASSTDAVNGSQLYATNQAITEVGKSAATAKTEVAQGNNIVVTETKGANGQSVYNVATAKEVSFDKTTVGTVITDSATGKITGLEAGTVSANSKDAINGSQLYSVSDSVSKAIGGSTTVNADGTITTSNIGGTGKNTVDEAITEVGKSAATAKTEVAQGDNMVVTESKGANGQSVYNVATAKEVSFDKTTVGTVITDSATGKITGLEAGTVSANSKDAINGSQLYSVSDSVSKAIGGSTTVNADGTITTSNIGGTGKNTVDEAITEVGKSAATAKTEVAQGDNIVVTESKGANGQSIYNVATAKEVSFDKTTVGTVVTDSATGKITGLNAGEVSATSTDAVNGSQLFATNKAIEDSKTHYVSVNDGGKQGANYNNDGATGKNAVAMGVGASAAGENAIAIGNNNKVAQNNTSVFGSNITTTQANSVVLGHESTDRAATSASKVTILGQDYAFAGVGSAANGVVSVGKVGGERQIINVAAGQLSATSTDAVNGSQLYATNQAISSLQDQVAGSKSTISEGKNTTVTKTTNADGSTDYQVATKDDVSFDSVTVGGIKADGQTNKITGLADGSVSATSNEAVNGSQLHGTAESVATSLGGNAKVNADGTISTSNIGNTGKDNVHDAIASIQGQVAGSKTSVSAGKNTVVSSSTNADGSNNYQVALADDIKLNSVTSNQVTANQVTANQVMANQVNVGKVTIDGTTNKVSGLANGTISKDSTDAVNGSQLHQTNSHVSQYLGGGSALNPDGTIAAPTYNVAGGTYHNVGDALGAVDARVTNLEQAFYNTNKNMEDLRNDTYAGIAGAMAVGNLPQPTEAGMSMMSAGLSGYRGETAVAVGISAITESNKIVWKMGASADSRSNIGGAVSVGYQWK